MQIRRSDVEDIPKIVQMLTDFHAESSFSDVSLCADTLKANLLKTLAVASFCSIVAEDQDGIIGFMLGRHGRYFFSKESAAWEEFIFVRPAFRGSSAGRRLVRHFIEWARGSGASKVHIGVNAGIDSARSGLFFERLGFTKTGEAFVYKIEAQPDG